MFNKKGVSEVVANVLIVLLVIVGIAVIWSVVKPTIDKSAEGIQADCFTLSVEPVTCTLRSGAYDIVVKRNPGAGTFEKVEVVFENAAGQSTRFTPTAAIMSTGASALDELETVTIAGATTSLTAPVTANVVVTSNGQLCPVTTQPVNCA